MSIKWSKSEKPILLLKSVISTQYLDKNGENFVNTTYPNVCQNLPTWSALNREPDAYEPMFSLYILCSQVSHVRLKSTQWRFPKKIRKEKDTKSTELCLWKAHKMKKRNFKSIMHVIYFNNFLSVKKCQYH